MSTNCSADAGPVAEDVKRSARQVGTKLLVGGVAALAGLIIVTAATARAADPDTLWKIVHDRCVPGERERANPRPCALVNEPREEVGGYAVLKDLNGVAQYLLIPTRRISGIEDPALLAPDAPHYFADAWRARTFVEGALGRRLPHDATALVINSVQGRSQEQLHIHIDCIRADVREELRLHAAEIGPTWTPFPVPLVGRNYLALRITKGGLEASDPFKLLAEGVPGARADMGLHTLILAGTTLAGQPDFVLLDRRVVKEVGDRGNGTELLDRTCGLTPAATH